MKYLSRGVKTYVLCVLSVLAAACGNGGAANYPITVGGSINGLTSGTQLQLEIDSTAPITVAANGPFVFPVAMPMGASYSVTVSGQPVGQSCEVWNGSGTVGASPVGSVFVTCTAVDRTVSGTVSGLLAGRSLVLQDDGGNSTTVSADGGFTFSTPVAGGSNYGVTVLTQPAGQHCAVTDGTGTMGSNEVSAVVIDCANGTYNLAVTVTGLAAGGLTLQDNGGTPLAISSNGTFNFNQPVTSGSAYAVTVASEPLGQSCSVSNGTGTVQSSNVTNIAVVCVSNLYQISGTLTGLLAGRSIVLQDNGGSSTVVAANGAFMFAAPVASGSGYAVTIFTQPVGQTCSVAMGSGTVAGADVGSVAVNCSDNTYDIQVSASGLLRTGLTLQDNGADNLSVGANGTYDFSTPLPSGAAYAVTVLTQPPGESCSVSNGTGPVVGATVTGIGVACTPTSYSVSGSVSGLLHGNSVVLEDNGVNATSVAGPVSGNVGFTFSTQLASGSGYAVTVSTQPPGQNCSVTNGSGPVVSSNVTGVTVNCGDYSYNVQATVTGLLSGNSIVLQDNGGDNLSFSTDASAYFATPIASGSAYHVTILSSPAGENCTVSSGSGTIASSNVLATINCTPIDYSIGGSVSGLITGRTITLEDNGGNATPVSGPVSGSVGFTFSTGVASGSNYTVSISAQPVGQSCSLTNSSGIVAAANVTNVGVSCADIDYNIGVSVSGLSGNGLVLEDNGGDNLSVAPSGGSTVTSTFATAVASGSAYDVTVLTQPTGQICSVTAPHSGTVTGANVTVALTCANTYTIGGTLSGLTTGSVVLADNGGNALTLSSNGTFAFTTPLAQGTTYAVTVSTQPSGQVCTLSAASGTVGAGNVTTVRLICAGAWTWMSGSKIQGGTAVYSMPGTLPASNTPGNRYSSLTWSDAAGNLWLFGGASYDTHGNNVYFNDLWKYNPGTGWTWISGSTGTNVSGAYGTLGTAASGNAPGSRSSPVSWTDSAGNLWLFGGYGYDSAGTLGNLNDLWEFNPTTGEWTWIGGSSTQNAYGVYGTRGTASLSNVPGARNSAVSWTDHSGNFWLFSGNGQAQSGTGGSLNDLWTFNPTLGWTWVSGSNGLDAVGSYGAAGDPGNMPGARTLSSAWIDGSNNLWVFGGQGYDSAGHFGYMNDLWQYSPTAGAWTWESGSSTVSALAVYGTKGVASAGNVPGARGYSNGWIDAAGSLWLFGGYSYNATGTQGIVDDLWTYTPGASTWTWVEGSATADVAGVYGTQRQTAASNVPGARYSASAWTDSSGNFWLFGGEGFDSSDSGGVLNDLWEYIP
jgi:N-acetylneuraminic acid mutarotase